MDGDGDKDLAVARRQEFSLPLNKVSILKNRGDGTFEPPVDYSTGPGPTSVFVFDLDEDGDQDLVLSDYGVYDVEEGTTVSVLKNNGDGTFAPRTGYGTRPGPFSLFVTDLDGDGDHDVVTANPDNQSLSILKNLSEGGCPLEQGDLNHDCEITLQDAVLAINCVFLSIGECAHFTLDLNCDGFLTPTDIVLMLNAIFLDTPINCS